MAASTYFLSYSRTDEGPALRFAAGLRAAGVSVWVDQWDIRASQRWDRAIEEAVRDCDGLIVILSPRSCASENVADEISFALENGKRVIPVLLERCVPPLRVTRMHLIDATTDLDRAVRLCLDEIEGGAGGSGPKVGPAAVRPPDVAASRVDAVAVDRVEARLRPVLGPMAKTLVSRAAASAGSEAELHMAVARHIEDGAARARFEALVSGPAASAPVAAPAPGEGGAAVSPGEIDRLAGLLTAYLGPLAPTLARREGRAATSAADLQERLGRLIPNAADRHAFAGGAAAPASAGRGRR